MQLQLQLQTMGQNPSIADRQRVKIYRRVSLADLRSQYLSLSEVKKRNVHFTLSSMKSTDILSSCPVSKNFRAMFGMMNVKLNKIPVSKVHLYVLSEEFDGRNEFEHITLEVLLFANIYKFDTIAKFAIIGLDKTQYDLFW